MVCGCGGGAFEGGGAWACVCLYYLATVVSFIRSVFALPVFVIVCLSGCLSV